MLKDMWGRLVLLALLVTATLGALTISGDEVLGNDGNTGTLRLFSTSYNATSSGVVVAPGTTVVLGLADVRYHARVRAYAKQRAGGQTAVTVKLVHVWSDDTYNPANMAEWMPAISLLLKSGVARTGFVEVPGWTLKVVATAAPCPSTGCPSGVNKVDVVVWAH